ncbi:MAG: phosphate signaling complex protein PhoU [Desulfobacterota bacterium]|nr:phosphate signaling complex protein PhoU [Thermodesulfobacteriota bacterium]
MFTERLHDLQENIVIFAGLVESMIEHAIMGLTRHDGQMLQAVIEDMEQRANAYEIDIDGRGMNVIAQYHPMAKDLRSVLMIYNINAALERIGDHAVNIALNAREIINHPPVKRFIDIPRMSELARNMLSGAIESFIRDDPLKAQSVCEQDDAIDGLRDQIIRELVTFMAEKPSLISDCLHIMRIADNLERIADLTTNICEDVIFMSTGRVIKHHCGDGEGHSA